MAYCCGCWFLLGFSEFFDVYGLSWMVFLISFRLFGCAKKACSNTVVIENAHVEIARLMYQLNVR